MQKNGGYDLEHAYTRDPTASKVFYLLLQMAHLIAQLIEQGSLFRQAFPAGVGSAKNIAFRLLEAWRNLRLSADRIQQMLDARPVEYASGVSPAKHILFHRARLQIRFAPS